MSGGAQHDICSIDNAITDSVNSVNQHRADYSE
jgi:hypothetical protein